MDAPDEPDPGRWLALALSTMAAFIVVMDNTVLNVSIPTILRELHTTLSALEWVIAGYSLTFAALLIIGGRLGDVYGHRKVFVAGFFLFGAGSLLASVSTSVGQLILGEAIIEGIGASLMLPSSLAILSNSFHGRERATAFAAWGATAGVAAAMGPVIGGFLTTNYSWRWSFRINVIIAPFCILGAFLVIRKAQWPERRLQVDLPGAVLVATGMFLLVFALGQGNIYGWWEPIKALSVLGHVVWPASRAVSATPLVLLVALAVLTAFVQVELRRGAAGRDRLFELPLLRLRSYRWGLVTAMVLMMGQLGLSFVLPVFLQNAKHLSAATNGLWMLPAGIFSIIGAQVGGRLIGRIGTTMVVRIGLLAYLAGMLILLAVVNLDITVWRLLPALALNGIGGGFANAQLTNVILSEIPPTSAGVASGANSTVRQVGAALGVSVIGSILTVQTVRAAVDRVHATSLPAAVQARVIAGVRSGGPGFVPPASLGGGKAAIVHHALEHSVVTGTRVAMGIGVLLILVCLALSLLLPSQRTIGGGG